MNKARVSIVSYLKKDLALLRRIGSPEERAEIPHIESALNDLIGVGEPVVVNFATGSSTEKEKEKRS